MSAEQIEWPQEECHPFTVTRDENKNDSAGNHLANAMLSLAMQQLGSGMQSVLTFLGTIGVRPSLGNALQWKKTQDSLGVTEEAVKDEVLKENKEQAIKVAKECGEVQDEDGKVGQTCCADAGWQKRSLGHTLDLIILSQSAG